MKHLVVNDERDIQFLFQQKYRNKIKSGKIEIKFMFNDVSELDLPGSFNTYEEYLIWTDFNMPQMNVIELFKETLSRIKSYGDNRLRG